MQTSRFCQLSDMSDHLWVRIFNVILADVIIEVELAAVSPKKGMRGLHRCFHHLRLVCKRFKRIFDEHPSLSARLFLDAAFGQQQLQSLLPHLQVCKISIDSFVSATASSKLSNVALAACCCSTSTVTTVILREASSCTISVLSACTMLTSCTLGSTRPALDLCALQSLHHLHSLRLLKGTYVQLPRLLTLHTLKL